MDYPSGWWQYEYLNMVDCQGCTDSDASNYMVNATADDGSCLYSGCTDSSATNYDAQATVDDGSCTYIVVNGCTDSFASNYNSSATVDDGSCTYEFFTEGEWRLKPEAGALCVGPNKGDCGWWSSSADDVTTRSCLFDDRVVFSTNGEMSNNHGNETWVESWQDNIAEGCRGYVTNDTWAANTATWSWSSSDSKLTVHYGYLGLLKAHDTGESDSLGNIADSRTYLIENQLTSIYICDGTEIQRKEMTAYMDYPSGWWKYVYLNLDCQGCTDAAASNYMVNATTDDGSCLYAGCTNSSATNYDAQG